MAIIGIGNDLVEISRIKAAVERHGLRFIHRVFTLEEQNKANNSYSKIAAYAKRFAAKEACAKALKIGIAQGITWKDFSISNDEAGAAHIVLRGKAYEILRAKTPPQQRPVIHVSLSDTALYAMAMVAIEAVPIAQLSD